MTSILKPGKDSLNPVSYHARSLLSVVYKHLERLFLNKMTPIVEPKPTSIQTGFGTNRCNGDQVPKLTQDIKDAIYQQQQTTELVLIGLTAAYDTIWLEGLEHKLRRIIPVEPMIDCICCSLYNPKISFIIRNSSGDASKICRLKNVVPKEQSLAPLPT